MDDQRSSLRRGAPPVSTFTIAVDIIQQADETHPADALLRARMKSERQLPAWDRAELAKLVFAYFRWFGWLGQEKTVPAKLRRAQELDRSFRSMPGKISEAELRKNAVPSWTAEEMEVPVEWLRTIQKEPTLWLRARKGQGSALAQRLGRAKLWVFPDALEYSGEEDLFLRPEFHSGQFEIQDIGSQWVGWLCDSKPGETWWDACAGEGGKTLHLSELMENKGLIWASDRAEWRLKNLKRRAGRAGVFNYRAALWDGSTKLPTKTKFDGVLVDAPCSGLGTWQRNPHARWTTTQKDVRELAAIQKQLLANVAGSVKPGGRLVYAVCTMTRAETSEVVEAFTSSHAEFEPLVMELPTTSDCGGLRPSAMLTLWPQHCGGNGMFVAAWRKKRVA